MMLACLPVTSLPRHGVLVTDRLVRFPGGILGRDRSLAAAAALGRFSTRSSACSRNPSPTLAGPFPEDDRCPVHTAALPADDVTIWSTITVHNGQEVVAFSTSARTPDPAWTWAGIAGSFDIAPDESRGTAGRRGTKGPDVSKHQERLRAVPDCDVVVSFRHE